MDADPPGPVPQQPAAPRRETARSGDAVAGDEPRVKATGVLADRMAAALVHREPGWRLPRRSALARRYNVSLTEIDAAVSDLARRSLVRRLPDGQLYRASPADYWIQVEGAAGLGTRLDPMGGSISCQTRHTAQKEAPQDVAWALGLAPGTQVRVVRCVWAAAGDPAAVSTAYLNESAAVAAALADVAGDGKDQDASGGPDEAGISSLDAVLNGLPAAAVSVEMSPPQPSVARSLRLSRGSR